MTKEQLDKGYSLSAEIHALRNYLNEVRKAKDLNLQESSANELRFDYPKSGNNLYLSLSANRHIHDILVQVMPSFLEGLEKHLVDRIAEAEEEFADL